MSARDRNARINARRFECAIPGCRGERAVMRDGRDGRTYESSQCLACQPDPHPDGSTPWERSAEPFAFGSVVEIEGLPADPSDDWPDDVEDLM